MYIRRRRRKSSVNPEKKLLRWLKRNHLEKILWLEINFLRNPSKFWDNYGRVYFFLFCNKYAYTYNKIVDVENLQLFNEAIICAKISSTLTSFFWMRLNFWSFHTTEFDKRLLDRLIDTPWWVDFGKTKKKSQIISRLRNLKKIWDFFWAFPRSTHQGASIEQSFVKFGSVGPSEKKFSLIQKKIVISNFKITAGFFIY